MKRCIGIKLTQPTPMTRLEYNKYRGWALPGDEDGTDDGYLVEYLDGGKTNDHRHKGYISWNPKEVFDNAYREVDGLSFGLAIEAAKKGMKIARKGWNGKDMFVVMQPSLDLPPFNTQGTARKVNDRTAKFIGEDKPLHCPPYFAMKAANEDWICGWLASQTDMLADDWMILDE